MLMLCVYDVLFRFRKSASTLMEKIALHCILILLIYGQEEKALNNHD